MPNIKMFFKSKKTEPKKEDSTLNQDLAIITQMNQEFATSLDLNETLQTALEVIIKRLNAQAANIFLIEDKKLMISRLFLLKGVKQVIANGLRVLGIKAPEEM